MLLAIYLLRGKLVHQREKADDEEGEEEPLVGAERLMHVVEVTEDEELLLDGAEEEDEGDGGEIKLLRRHNRHAQPRARCASRPGRAHSLWPQQCEMAVGGQLWLAYFCMYLCIYNEAVICMYVRMVAEADWN